MPDRQPATFGYMDKLNACNKATDLKCVKID